jgi:hypothetical protein
MRSRGCASRIWRKLPVIALLPDRVELVEEENRALLRGVVEDAAKVGRRLPQVRRDDPVEARIEEREPEVRCEDLCAERLAAAWWSDEEESALGRQAVARKQVHRPDLFFNAIEARSHLGGKDDLVPRALRMMEVNERGIPIGIAGQGSEGNHFLGSRHVRPPSIHRREQRVDRYRRLDDPNLDVLRRACTLQHEARSTRGLSFDLQKQAQRLPN